MLLKLVSQDTQKVRSRLSTCKRFPARTAIWPGSFDFVMPQGPYSIWMLYQDQMMLFCCSLEQIPQKHCLVITLLDAGEREKQERELGLK